MRIDNALEAQSQNVLSGYLKTQQVWSFRD